MELFELKDKRFVAIDGDKAVLFDKENLVKELEGIEQKLQSFPQQLTDAELLDWARNNAPIMNYNVEINLLNSRKEEILKLLEAMK
jgi:hypothetical protein